jgi:flagellar hook protein FlgE
VVTSTAAIGVNLSSTELGINNAITPFDPTAANTYNKSTALGIYDSAGASHVASVYFQRIPLTTITATTASGALLLGASSATLAPTAAGMAIGNKITIAGAGTAGGLHAATITDIAGNVITFSPATATAVAAGAVVNSDAGSLKWNVFLTVDGAIVPGAAVPAAPGAANALTTLTFGNNGSLISPLVGMLSAAPGWVGATGVTYDLAACTQYAGTFDVKGLSQDGYAAGTLSGYSTDKNGVILGRYTNGQSQALGQILLTNFSNPQGLQPVGNNEWAETVAAGILGSLPPGTSGRGVLQSSAVEESNVDLTAELVSMIVAQRMYQANAQTIKAQDQILQTIVNLK